MYVHMDVSRKRLVGGIEGSGGSVRKEHGKIWCEGTGK